MVLICTKCYTVQDVDAGAVCRCGDRRWATWSDYVRRNGPFYDPRLPVTPVVGYCYDSEDDLDFIGDCPLHAGVPRIGTKRELRNAARLKVLRQASFAATTLPLFHQ